MATAHTPGSFGVLLLRHRVAAALSQEELAERAGLSRRGISDLERGTRQSPHPATARRLADALELSGPDKAMLLHAAHEGSSGTSPTSLSGVAHETQGHAEATAAERRHNLPLALSSFVGRRSELNQLQEMLTTTRLVTLVGIGGIGK